MRKVMSEERKAQRPDLIEYDRKNISPHFTPELIRYIESRQPGLSDRDHAKLDEIEWFVLNLNTGCLTSLAMPGLREYKNSIEIRYIKRFSEKTYNRFMKMFMDYVPPDFPSDQIGRYHGEALRLTSPNGDHFYPIYFNGNLPAWRKRLDDNAAFFKTSIGRFEHGKFSSLRWKANRIRRLGRFLGGEGRHTVGLLRPKIGTGRKRAIAEVELPTFGRVAYYKVATSEL